MTRFLGTCSVCFASHVLTVRCRPQRHGFAVMGAGNGHGHLGAWHTGPCFGGEYVHLGESCQGTEVALSRAVAHRVGLQEYADRLAGRPMLTWHWSESVSRARRLGRAAETKQFAIEPGHEAHGARLMIRDAIVEVQVPAYEALLNERVAQNAAALREIEQTIETYRKVIAEWAPEKWPTTNDDGKPIPVHLSAIWRWSRKGDAYTVGACSVGQRTPPIGQRTTPVHDAVTCARCRRAIEAADKERARRAAILHYRVELPDGSIAETTNTYQGTKRPLCYAVITRREQIVAGAKLGDSWHVDRWAVSMEVARKAQRDAQGWAKETRIIALEQP